MGCDIPSARFLKLCASSGISDVVLFRKLSFKDEVCSSGLPFVLLCEWLGLSWISNRNCNILPRNKATVESLSDTELKSILEALHIATQITVVYPPLEQSRIYRGMEDVWDKFATEAIARGLTDYAEYFPESEGAYPGDALEIGSDADEALSYHDQEQFWNSFTGVVAGIAGIHDHGSGFPDFPTETRVPIHSDYEQRVNKILEDEGIATFIDVRRVINKEESGRNRD